MLKIITNTENMGLPIEKQEILLEFSISGDLLQVCHNFDIITDKRSRNIIERYLESMFCLYNLKGNNSYALSPVDMELWNYLIYNSASISYDFLFFLFKVRRREYTYIRGEKAFIILRGLWGLTLGGAVSKYGLVKNDDEDVSDIWINYKPRTDKIVMFAGAWSGRLIGQGGKNIFELKKFFNLYFDDTYVIILSNQVEKAE